MKSFIILALLLCGCSTAPKYRKGDCVSMEAMYMSDSMEWNSTGHELGMFKVVDVVETDKMNRFMADRLHANKYYKIKFFNKNLDGWTKDTYAVPVEDLDSFRYASVFWYPNITSNKDDCNSYRPGE